MSEALFRQEPVFEIRPEDLERLKERARESATGRFRLCLHGSVEDPVQDMVICVRHGAYIRPHRHPEGKRESYLVVEGAMDVFLFSDAGEVTRCLHLGEPRSGRSIAYCLAGPIWHLPVLRSDFAIYHEVYTGPFDKDTDVEYAPWSPAESDRGASMAFLAELEHPLAAGDASGVRVPRKEPDA